MVRVIFNICIVQRREINLTNRVVDSSEVLLEEYSHSNYVALGRPPMRTIPLNLFLLIGPFK